MLAKVYSAAVYGLDAHLVEVEVDIFWGLPGISLVGLPDTAVQEAKERVRSAIKHSGYDFPGQRITINMAPANTRKYGPVFDLPIALGLLWASEQIHPQNLQNYLVIGELSLDGSLRPIEGALAFALAGLEAGKSKIILPRENTQDLSFIPELQIYPARNLMEICAHLEEACCIPPVQIQPVQECSTPSGEALDLQEIKGQGFAKRGLEIAAAGGHNLLMVGPPGSGKTLMAKSLASILPPLEFKQALESRRIHSIAGLDAHSPLHLYRPFRAPHHSITRAGLMGGCTIPKPGEISLAHLGVLFLDELPEFSKTVLEVLRQPLEEHAITISRANKRLKFPAKFQLIAAMNPCPCGYWGDTKAICHCSASQVRRYWQKLSGPLLDRLDLHIEVPRLSAQDLLQNATPGQSSAELHSKIHRAHTIQKERFVNTETLSNACMSPIQIKQFCKLKPTAQNILHQAIEQLGLSARSYHHILKIARTIADLERIKEIQTRHLLEAIQFRNLDRRNYLPME